MEKQIIVSGGDALRAFSLENLALMRRVPLEACGVLCAGRDALYCAAQGGSVIWRLDARTLMPSALFAGGPEIGDMRLNTDGTLLYVLLSGGDSVLLLDARTGAPMLLNRAGVNPARMALDERAGVLAVAGGQRGSVLLLCAKTLACLKEMPMPGAVIDVALRGGKVHALCMSGTLQSLLVTTARDGRSVTRRLAGMPGALLAQEGRLFAAAEDRVFVFGRGGAYAMARLPGCASRLALAGGRLLLLDQYTQTLMAKARGGRPFQVCDQAGDMIVM